VKFPRGLLGILDAPRARAGMSACRPIASTLASQERRVDDDKLKLAADVPSAPKPVSALMAFDEQLVMLARSASAASLPASLYQLQSAIDVNHSALRGSLVRAAGFFGFWLVLSGFSLIDLLVGALAAAAATWASLRLLAQGAVALASGCSLGPRAALSASVRRRGDRRGMARARSADAFAARLRGLSAATSTGRNAKRVLHHDEPAAGHAPVRSRRKRRSRRALSRCRPACGRAIGHGGSAIGAGTGRCTRQWLTFCSGLPALCWRWWP